MEVNFMEVRQRQFFVEGNTLPEAYHKALIAVHEYVRWDPLSAQVITN